MSDSYTQNHTNNCRETTVTNEHERRQHERKRIISEIAGEFQIIIEDKIYPVLNVKDISISGISITFIHRLATHTNIRLNFNAADLKLAINGRVAWCSESKNPTPDSIITDAFQVGIEFNSKNSDHNCLLFMALRKYLDEFQ